MPKHQESRILPYTADQMYAVVADIERYPEFLPWCSRLRVLKREAVGGIDIVTAEMVVSYKAFRERYISRVTMNPAKRSIEAVHVEGPFKTLDSVWRFQPLEKGCEVTFAIDFAFKSPFLSAVANVAFGFVAARMTESFIERADALYGAHIA
jgi:coenzyme Q-binding protein COQ10